MISSNTQRNRIGLTIIGCSLVALALSGCSTNETQAEARSRDTVPIWPMMAGTVAPSVTVAPSITVAATIPTPASDAPTTATDQPPTTTDAPTTTAPPATDAPTTSEAPTTSTEAPSTTTAPLPPNVEVVGAFPTPIPAVGTRGGADTQVVQLRLLQLGFWNGGADGKYGTTTRQAVMAFQKYVNIPATGQVDADTATWLTNIAEKAHGQADTGTLVEIDKARQLLFFVVDGKTQWVLNTSTATGKEYEEKDKNTPGEVIKGVSITPDGLWKTTRERPEGWWEGDLGEIYRPKYFHGGVAVHGSNSVPNYPASHGCVRVSVQAMDWIWDTNLMPLKTTVWVHS